MLCVHMNSFIDKLCFLTKYLFHKLHFPISNKHEYSGFPRLTFVVFIAIYKSENESDLKLEHRSAMKFQTK